MLSTLLALSLLTAATPADTVVVCPTKFRAAMKPWLELRESQGHECLIVSSDSADGIRRRIRAAAGRGNLRYIVLVGDAPAKNVSQATATTVPTHYVDSQIIHRFGGEKSIAGDNWYADLDDDHLPDVAIGRLPADTPEQLSRMIKKIIAYENRASVGDWQRRISLVAGMGGFGAFADAAIEASAKQLLVEGIPSAFTTTVTYGSWRSPYFPDPHAFHDATVSRFNEGCLFWVYMGHGQTNAVDRVRTPEGQHHILAAKDCAKLRCGDRPPVALFLCCSTGGFDQKEDCLAEELVKADGGAVAALAGSRVTMPYAMSVLGAEMLRLYFQEDCGTAGELLKEAKRSMILSPRDDARSQAIDALAKVLNPASTDLAAERAEHLDLFNLLGDPLLQIPRASIVKIDAPERARPGEELIISGTSPIDGTVEVELVVRRDRLTFRPTGRNKYASTEAARAEFQSTYEKANDCRLTTVSAPAKGGKFTARLTVPASASGPCHIRVFVAGGKEAAVGAADVMIDSRVAQARAGDTGAN